MKFLINALIYGGSALMVYNIYSFITYAKMLAKKESFKNGGAILIVPSLLLIFFLLGYLGIGIFGTPDLLISMILFFGSVFVTIMVYLLRRITAKLEEGEEARVALKAAEEARKQKDLFLSSISHEMRTPLNAIVGLQTVISSEKDLSDVTRDRLDKIGFSARYLTGLIDNLLDISQAETNVLTLDYSVFSLKELLHLLNLMFEQRCEEKKITYVSREINVVDDRFYGDQRRIRQILLSILDNAVKFTPEGGTVTCIAEEVGCIQDKRLLLFTIEDTGIGISEDHLPKLFTAFSQEDTTNTNRYGGSGLGLALTKQLVDLMGGDIKAESVKGQGSRFLVTIPLKPVPEEGQTVEDTASAGTPDYSGYLHGKHLLIADDIDLNAEIVIDLLDLEEATADRAENGEEAVAFFARSQPGFYDAILMDIRMPVMDGFDAARRIREMGRSDSKTIPILALTANATETDRQRSMDAGMNVHLTKPVDADLLYQSLGKLIAEREAAE